MTEAQWQKQVIAMAHACGYLVAHFRPGMNQRGRWMTAVAGDGVGFFDLVLVHEKSGDTIFAELKAEKGRMRPEQERWAKAVAADGGERCYLWRPSDFEAVRQRLMNPRKKAA